MFVGPDWPEIHRHFLRRVVAAVAKQDPAKVDLETLLGAMFWASHEFGENMHLKENVAKTVDRVLLLSAEKMAATAG